MRTSALPLLALSSTLIVGVGLVAPPASAAVAAPAYGSTWTVDSANSSLIEYAAGASGAATPIATVIGADTGLDSPSGVAMDDVGDVYVANAGNSTITEYAVGASGDAMPIETIAGTATALDEPSSIAIGQDLVWVTDPAINVVEAFTPGSDGDVLPAETISGPKTLLDRPVTVSSDDEGGVWVANRPISGSPSIENFDGSGDVAPEALVHGSASGLQTPAALAADDFGGVFVADSATNTISDFEPIPGIPGGNDPVTKIAGAKTGLNDPNGLAIDATGQLLVSNAGNKTIEAFGGEASGDPKPERAITGVGGADGPTGVSVLASAPGAPTDLKVKAHNASAHLSWDAPTDTGGGITDYQVLAFPIPTQPTNGSFLTTSAEHSTKATSITLHHLTNGVPYSFQVLAENAYGDSGSEFDPFDSDATATPSGPPGVPRGVTVVPGAGELKVFWAAPLNDGGKKITSYRVQYSACPLGAKGCVVHTHKVAGDKRHEVLSGLIVGQTYRVRLLAHTSKGTGKPSKTISKTVE